MKITLEKFKQYHLRRRIVWSSQKDHPAENYKWLLRFYTGINNWVWDLTRLTIIVLCFAVLGCSDRHSPSSIEQTKESMASPELVGTLPDGREVFCFIRYGGDLADHFIYFVKNPDNEGHTTSTNYHQSKSNHVIVEIDGVKYVPVENTENTENIEK